MEESLEGRPEAAAARVGVVAAGAAGTRRHHARSMERTPSRARNHGGAGLQTSPADPRRMRLHPDRVRDCCEACRFNRKSLDLSKPSKALPPKIEKDRYNISPFPILFRTLYPPKKCPKYGMKVSTLRLYNVVYNSTDFSGEEFVFLDRCRVNGML